MNMVDRFMVTILDPCDGCGAEPGEECRWSCLSWEEGKE